MRSAKTVLTVWLLLFPLALTARADFVDALLDDLAGTDAAKRPIARQALARVNDPRVTQAVIANAANPLNPLDIRVGCVNVIRLQKLAEGTDTLLLLTTDTTLAVPLRGYAAVGLAELTGTKNVDLFLKLIRGDEIPAMKHAAAQALGSTGDATVIPRIVELFDDPKVAVFAVVALSTTKNPDIVPILIDKLTTDNVLLRNTIITSLGQIGDKRAIEPLIALLKTSNELQKIYVLKALGSFDDPVVTTSLAELLSSKTSSYNVRMNALLALEKIKAPATFSTIVAVATGAGEDVSLRMTATRVLGNFGIDAMPTLINLLDDKALTNSAVLALSKITGAFYGRDRERWVQYYNEHKKDQTPKP